MTNKTRKRLWPVSLVMAVAVVGVVAAFLMMASSPTNTAAHDGASGSAHCDDLGFIGTIAHDEDPDNDHDCATGPTDPGTGGTGTGTGDSMHHTGHVEVPSDSPSKDEDIFVTVDELLMNLPSGSSIVVFLRDEWSVPESIPASAVYFVVENQDGSTTVATGSGARVRAVDSVKIDGDTYFSDDSNDDSSIRVFIPDMCPSQVGAGNTCVGFNGPSMGQKLTMVIEGESGIRSPSEAGRYDAGFQVLGPLGSVTRPEATNLEVINAKISLSDVDNKRGYELLVNGSGFNDGTTAGVYVLNGAPVVDRNADGDPLTTAATWWDNLNCREMVDAVNRTYDGDPDSVMGMPHATMDSPNTDAYCKMYEPLGATEKRVVRFYFGIEQCKVVVDDGTLAGSATIGSDDKVAVTVEVTPPTFKPGKINYVCVSDGESRRSVSAKIFNLQPSIKVVPDTVSSGDTVNVFAQDFAHTGSLHVIKLAGKTVWSNSVTMNTASDLKVKTASLVDGGATISFDVPGSVSDKPLQGTVRVDAQWGSDVNDDGKCKSDDPCTSKNSKITIGGSQLSASKTDVRPNETITINGNGFGSQTCIDPYEIRLSDVSVIVDEESVKTSGRCDGMVEVSNSGQFVATIILWHAMGTVNPTLTAGTHQLSVTDNEGFTGTVNFSVAEPTVTVTPDIAGPRDYITVSGANWPVDNAENSLEDSVTVEIDDSGNIRRYPVYPDNAGRFTVEHRVHRNVGIPSNNRIKASYVNLVVKVGSYAVPASTITVTPGSGQPGDIISLSASNMPVYTEAKYVEIGGTTYDNPGVNTDRDGNITIDEVLIPGLDPGVYSVVIGVGGTNNLTIAIGEVNVLAESSAAGAPAELPGAVESLGDNLVAIFHFDDVGKVWSFYDPRPEFADLNTLTEMVNGEAYWILVSETVDDVVLNNKARSLTCRGADCWNLEVW